MGQKILFLPKQTGEVAENKGKDYIGSQKQTGKQSGEVIENTCLWKKQTGTKLKNKAGHVVENKRWQKYKPKTNRNES